MVLFHFIFFLNPWRQIGVGLVIFLTWYLGTTTCTIQPKIPSKTDPTKTPKSQPALKILQQEWFRTCSPCSYSSSTSAKISFYNLELEKTPKLTASWPLPAGVFTKCIFYTAARKALTMVCNEPFFLSFVQVAKEINRRKTSNPGVVIVFLSRAWQSGKQPRLSLGVLPFKQKELLAGQLGETIHWDKNPVFCQWTMKGKWRTHKHSQRRKCRVKPVYYCCMEGYLSLCFPSSCLACFEVLNDTRLWRGGVESRVRSTVLTLSFFSFRWLC